MKNVICLLMGHSWKYNFPTNSQPNKRICAICKQKQVPYRFGWSNIIVFLNEERTDNELIKNWFKN